MKRSKRRAGYFLKTEITCEYLGAATADGYTLDRKPTLRCTVGVKWSYRDESTNESLTKRVRYDYYLSHGITFPEHWKTAFKCDFLSRIAQEAAVRFAQESAFEDVSCRFAGAPLPVEVYTDGRIAAGSILKVAWSGIPHGTPALRTCLRPDLALSRGIPHGGLLEHESIRRERSGAH